MSTATIAKLISDIKDATNRFPFILPSADTPAGLFNESEAIDWIQQFLKLTSDSDATKLFNRLKTQGLVKQVSERSLYKLVELGSENVDGACAKAPKRKGRSRSRSPKIRSSASHGRMGSNHSGDPVDIPARRAKSFVAGPPEPAALPSQTSPSSTHEPRKHARQRSRSCDSSDESTGSASSTDRGRWGPPLDDRSVLKRPVVWVDDTNGMDGILFRSGGSNSWSEVEAIKESILFDCFAQSCSTNSFVIDDDKRLIETVVLVYPYFTTATIVFDRLVKTFRSCGNQNDTSIRRTRVFDAIKTFLRHERFRTRHDKSKDRAVEKFVSELAQGDDQEQSFGGYLLRMFQSADDLATLKAVSSPPKTSRITDDVETFPDADRFAEQLALVEHRFFLKVKPSDIHEGNWLNDTSDHNAVAAWSEHSNKLSRWAATKVLRQPSKLLRAKMISKLIHIIEALKELQCFSGMMTLFTTLNLFAISRLKSTWKHVSKPLRLSYEQLEHSMNPVSNFSGYRDMLARATIPCVPYVGVVTKDVTALEELPTLAKDQYLHWTKLSHIAKTLREFFRFQTSSYEFEEDKLIISELLNFEEADMIKEEEMLGVSLSVEPDTASTKLDRTPVPPSNQGPKTARRLSMPTPATNEELVAVSGEGNLAKLSKLLGHQAVSTDNKKAKRLLGINSKLHLRPPPTSSNAFEAKRDRSLSPVPSSQIERPTIPPLAASGRLIVIDEISSPGTPSPRFEEDLHLRETVHSLQLQLLEKDAKIESLQERVEVLAQSREADNLRRAELEARIHSLESRLTSVAESITPGSNTSSLRDIETPPHTKVGPGRGLERRMSVMGPAPKDISMLIQGKEKADLEIKSLHIQMEQKNIIIENLVKTTGDMKQRMDEMARSFATLTKHRHK